MLKLPVTKLIDAKSALNFEVKIPVSPGQNVREWIVYVVFGAGTSAGAVMVESAHDTAFAGTWSNVATISWAAASRTHHAAITGAHIALKLRISTGIVGGTVDAYVMGLD